MTVEKAKQVIFNNCYCIEKSFVYYLHEECEFNISAFWEYYDSIIALVELAEKEKTLDLTMQISRSYQRILQEIISHFSSIDIVSLENFPNTYNEYMERIDLAIEAYFKGEIVFSENDFDLQR